MINQVGTLPFIQDVFNKMMSYEKGGLVAFSCVNKILASMAIEFAKTYYPEGCFGKAQWLNYNGKTEEEPPLSLRTIQEFDPSKYMLTFIPETINDEPLTLDSIDKFVSTCKKIKTSNYEFALNFFGINKVPLEKLKAHFVMLSKEIFPGTLEVSFENQKELLKNKGFEIPNLVDTVVSLLLHNITTDFRYFNEEHETIFIHVKEDGRFNCPIIVGRN